jgi:hypothetical protein
MNADRWSHLAEGSPLQGRDEAPVHPGVGVSLAVATGMLWYSTTRPLESLRLLAGAPDVPLSVENWGLLLSSIFGGVVLAAGVVAIAAWLVGRCTQAAGERRTPRLYALSSGPRPGSTILIQRLHADMASCEARFRTARRSADPREIARVVATGRQAMEDILLELEAAGVHVEEIGAD